MELGLRAPLDQEIGSSPAIERIASAYSVSGRRDSLAAVEGLRRALPPRGPMLAIAVVGTNGKTSTATYLARLLSAADMRTGLYVSPHIVDWDERIRVDDLPCDPVATLEVIHELAGSSGQEARDLRFFDLLTLAAEQIFADERSEVAVFEAGIGGRLDAVRVLEPPLVILTSVAVDHAEILGDRPAEVLREKLLVAPPGSTVLSFPLGEGLDGIAERLAEEAGFQMAWVDPAGLAEVEPAVALPAYLRAALALAAECVPLAGAKLGREVCGEDSGRLAETLGRIDLSMPGRVERGEYEGVPYVLDIAHNEAAWRELAGELRRRPLGEAAGSGVTALFSVSPGKRRAGLVDVLRSVPGLRSVVVTRHLAKPAAEPAAVVEELRAGGLEADAVEDVAAATSIAFDSARRDGGGVLALGSTYLIAAVRGMLKGTPG